MPATIIVHQMGLAHLIKEEAALAERQTTGKPLSRRQRLIAELRSLDPQGAEFYTVAAGYLRKQFRPNRTYGLFFLFLGGGPLLLTLLAPRRPVSETLLFVLGAIIFGSGGLKLFYHSSATVRNLPKACAGENADQRLQRLWLVASHNRTDPIAALVLELTAGSNNDPDFKLRSMD